MSILKEFLVLNLAIQKNFNPLNWIDITKYEDGTGSITFADDGESEDEFFAKMVNINEFIKEFGYSASLTKYEADKLCPYSEARIDINFVGGELE